MRNPSEGEVYDAIATFLDTFGITPDMCPHDGVRIGDGQVVVDVYATDPDGKMVAFGNEILRHSYTFPFSNFYPARQAHNGVLPCARG